MIILMHDNLLIISVFDPLGAGFVLAGEDGMFGLIGQIIGVIIIIIGGLMLFFLHGPEEHQSGEFGISFIFLGLALIIIGGLLLFVA
jgi:hypothetical protein